ncbi:flagellar basal body P-ring formation protein FlgA [Bradyrhizobium tropiciagri]|uniref:flagellar basal body P-ring formation chaperone FlgA n=1 Tax=Bradyrhizobium tropiciagri TaxID=312253 RepID=UPI001BAC3DCA|nr:flagellar basal body P-ring formation chaperone FlgA [Bradyrhizobium tropiciagri]MBR0896345.1 flagellar basal body P-ring formation protein FlgA [Bradyrhizobium tropiciagri]
MIAMIARPLLIAAALLALTVAPAAAQSRSEPIAVPTLRASITVADDIVRVGDLIDNAGSAGSIAIYRAPDLGTTGTLPVAQVLNVLRTHQVIGVDTRELKEITVTRLARTIDNKEIEQQVSRALEGRHGLGRAGNIALTFDRDPGDIRLEATNTGTMQPVSVRYDARSTRFDVTFEIGNDAGTAPYKMRLTGTAIETIEAAVLTRSVERGDVLKASDVTIERRPKADIGNDAATRDGTIGMQMRRQVRAGQALRVADMAKPDLVTRDQNVTLIYRTAGIYLTIRGKAIDGGAEGDVVNVMNLQSKRSISGVVTGRGEVSISVATPRAAPDADATSSISAPVKLSSVAPNAE